MTTFKDIPPEARLPEDQNLYDIYYDKVTKNWQPFSRFLGKDRMKRDLMFHEIFIPTVDSVRNKHI